MRRLPVSSAGYEPWGMRKVQAGVFKGGDSSRGGFGGGAAVLLPRLRVGSKRGQRQRPCCSERRVPEVCQRLEQAACQYSVLSTTSSLGVGQLRHACPSSGCASCFTADARELKLTRHRGMEGVLGEGEVDGQQWPGAGRSEAVSRAAHAHSCCSWRLWPVWSASQEVRERAIR